MADPVDLGDGYEGFAVAGRPADCIKLALAELWPDRFGGGRPDLVVSGMNAGANCGINVIYSGTVAAAIEAAFLGIPSIAVSLHLGRGEPDFDLAASHARWVFDRVLDAGLLRPGSCININVPRTEVLREGDPPISVCPMNVHGIVDRFARRESPSRRAYYWAAGTGLEFHQTDEGTDVERLLAGSITVTPLTFDLTKNAEMAAWRDALSTPAGS